MDKVTHFEIPADDLGRAKKFYKSLFGWQITDIPDMNYTMINTVEVDKKNMPKEKGAINGGLMKRNHPSEVPVIVVAVSSVDKYLKKAEAAGAKIALPKQTVGDMGFYARITDTEGNVIGIWENQKK